ncbi:oxidoreductase [Apiospora arundinis]
MIVGNGTCCAALALSVNVNISFPGSVPYDRSLASYWSLQEAEVRPSCIVTPSNRDEAALAIKTLGLGIKWAHPWAGAANIEAGVVVALQKLNQVTVSVDEKTVQVGPGNRWGDVYRTLDSRGLAVLGGRLATVGVGGLVTGGGFSHFSPRYGFVCDTVDDFEIVLASGAIVNANASVNSDLWRALRGGSNNFGIVTAFTMRSFKQENYWGGSIISDGSHIDNLLQTFEAFTGNPEYDPYATNILNLIWQPATDSWITLQSPSYTKTQTNPPALIDFTSVPALVNTMRISNSTDFANELFSASGQRQLMITATFRNSLPMLRAIHEIQLQMAPALRNISGLQWSLSLQPQPSIMFKASAEAGDNSLGLDESDGNLFNVLLTATWADKKDDPLVVSQTRRMFEQFEAKAERLGVTNPYLYLNYAASWQDPINGYGAESKEFLQKVSNKYDPEGLFQKNVPGGFKLFK